MTRLLPAVDSGVQADVAYFDFRKAFNTVNIDFSFMKLSYARCMLQILSFFESYMRNKHQVVDDQWSEP